MKYAMLSYLIPPESEDEFRKNSRHNMQDAASLLQWNIVKGIKNNIGEHIDLFNILPVDSFPQYYKKPWIKKYKFENNGVNIGFCNIKLIRNYLMPLKIYKALSAWCKADDDKKVLFVYTISAPFMKAVSKLKKKFPQIIVCPIVADLPDMASLSEGKSFLKKLFIKVTSDNSYDLAECADGYVLLTKHMADYMKLTCPFVVMEGIAPEVNNIGTLNFADDGKKNIVYSGTLHKRFGVLNLVNAFSKIHGDEYRLIICGVGDSEAEIIKAADKDNRILFLGQLRHSEVMKLQHKATVLVNPRMNNEDFTKYSFPSKTLEYMASGIPAVVYKLDGIPDEYDAFLNYPCDDSEDALAKLLLNICSLSAQERQQMGSAAHEFVFTYKNKDVQSKLILEFVNKL